MAVLEQRTRPYEILIRFWPDGRVGAHYQTIMEILSDGVVIATQTGDFVALSTPDFPSQGPTVDAIIGMTNTEVMAENEALITQNTALVKASDMYGENLAAAGRDRDELAARLAEAQDQLAAMQTQITVANSSIESLSATLDDDRLQIADLNSQIAELTASKNDIDTQLNDALSTAAELRDELKAADDALARVQAAEPAGLT